MSNEFRLALVVKVGDAPLRSRVEGLLRGLAEAGSLARECAGWEPRIVSLGDDAETFRWFSNHIDQRDNDFAILISDELLEDERLRDGTWTYTPNSFAKELLEQIEGQVATIAIMDRPQRVEDIDRTVSVADDSSAWMRALALCSRRLAYVARPAKRPLPGPVHVRRIRNMSELRDYFRLRHEIYSVMGYLTTEVESANSRMEMNWNDRTAIPLGAFLQQPHGREELVGTARLALTSLAAHHPDREVLREFERWSEALSREDPVCKAALDRPLMLELPIFHSVREILSPGLLTEQVCGELSRVIVAPECRGAGISSRLVAAAIAEAQRIGVQRLFLECLPIHAGMYTRFGFRAMDLPAARVINVKRTMVPFEWTAAANESASSGDQSGGKAIPRTAPARHEES